ncbi:OmpH outer membrane protein [Dissulfurispira thermophila]|uniref:OmpH outer membrane protein n=2 Tax=root TaxID=1 RepID=A0A7G1H412_9BACT|nr:OmpH family outer membrane protein [Dissulfurispira thermophila]BCB97458.1 OmpH outer membrane protein [Dissulfurispira thermophila]
MRRSLFVLSAVCFLLLFTIFDLFAENLKIGVFDIQQIMRDSKTINVYRKQMLQEVDAKKKILSEKQQAVRQVEERLKKESMTLPPEERKNLEERLANEIKELRRLNEDIEIELRKKDAELLKKAFTDIQAIIKTIAEKDGYTIIFEKNAAGIVHVKGSVDITQKIMKLYDKQ